MKRLRKLLFHFAMGLLAGFGLILVIYCISMPAIPFVYVGF